jgi:hypothetical protein
VARLIVEGGIVRRSPPDKYRRGASFFAVDPAYLPPGTWFTGVEPPVSRRLELERSMERRRQERMAANAARPAPPPPEPERLEEWQVRIRAARDAALNPQVPPGFGKAVGKCTVCGFPLDAIFADLGHHTAPAATR